MPDLHVFANSPSRQAQAADWRAPWGERLEHAATGMVVLRWAVVTPQCPIFDAASRAIAAPGAPAPNNPSATVNVVEQKAS